VAVAAFLNKRIHFLDISQLIAKALETIKTAPVTSLEQLIAVDNEARRYAQEHLCKLDSKRVVAA
jgi:1-deoxy-D-xylulose-5-phosphate reductoisomerase